MWTGSKLSSPVTRLLVGALVVGAAGLGVSRAGFAPGVLILAAAAVLVAGVRRWWAPLLACLAFTLVFVIQLGNEFGTGLSGDRGLRAALGNWALLLGFAVALFIGAAGFARAVRGVRVPRLRRSRGGHLGFALALLPLSAICAEDLAAYDDTTGRPAELLAGVVIFGFLYGGPALLMREFVRRTGRGWLAILLLATAAGLVQAGLIDQSMFNESYRDIESWDDLWHPTKIDALGLSAYATQSFIVGHLVYSFSAPIALVEAARPAAARQPWAGWKTLTVVALLYLAVAGLVLSDTLGNEPTRPSAAQISGTLAVVAGLVAAALRTRVGTPSVIAKRRAPRPPGVFAVSFGAATVLALAPSTWAGVVLSGAVLALGGGLLVRASRSVGRELHHVIAVAAAPSSVVPCSPSRITHSSVTSRQRASTRTTSSCSCSAGR